MNPNTNTDSRRKGIRNKHLQNIKRFLFSLATFNKLPKTSVMLVGNMACKTKKHILFYNPCTSNTLPFCFSKVSTNSNIWHVQNAASYEHLHTISCRYLQCCCLHARYSCRTSRDAQTIGLAWNEGGYFNSFSGKNSFHFVTYTEVKKDTMMEATLLHTQLIDKYLNNNKYKEQQVIKN